MRQLILLSFSLFSSIAFGQITGSLTPCWAHLDKPFYVTEDVIGFQLYLPSEFEGVEVMVQSILFDPNGQAVTYAYWSTNGKTHINGVQTLPTSLPSSWYYMSFRVWDDINKTERVLVQVPIAVYNDQVEVLASQVSQREPSAVTKKVVIPEKELYITISSFPQFPEPNEKLTIQVQITNKRGRPVAAQFSLSISDWSLLSPSLAMGMDNLYSSDSLRVITPNSLTADFYWQGLLLNEAKEANPNQKILATKKEVLGGKTLQVDGRGRVHYQSEPIGQDSINWTYANGQPANLLFYPQAGRLVMGELFYSPAVFSYLNNSRQRKQIYRLYDQKQYSEISPVYNTAIKTKGLLDVYGSEYPLNSSWGPTSLSAHLPSQPSFIWQPNQQTNADGRWTISFTQGVDVSAFRVDVVAQDDDGNRGRGAVVYRVKN